MKNHGVTPKDNKDSKESESDDEKGKGKLIDSTSTEVSPNEIASTEEEGDNSNNE